MAKVTLLDGSKAKLNGAQASVVLGSRRRFKDQAELGAFLGKNADLIDSRRPASRWMIVAAVQQRSAVMPVNTA